MAETLGRDRAKYVRTQTSHSVRLNISEASSTMFGQNTLLYVLFVSVFVS